MANASFRKPTYKYKVYVSDLAELHFTTETSNSWDGVEKAIAGCTCPFNKHETKPSNIVTDIVYEFVPRTDAERGAALKIVWNLLQGRIKHLVEREVRLKAHVGVLESKRQGAQNFINTLKTRLGMPIVASDEF